MKTYRFWWYHHGYVKMSVNKDQDRAIIKYRKHDEGYEVSITHFYIDDDRLCVEFITRGKDCDGRYDECQVFDCGLDELNSIKVDDNISIPYFRLVD